MNDLDSTVADQSQAGKSGSTDTGGDTDKDINNGSGVQPSGEGNADGQGQDQLPPELEEVKKKLLSNWHEKNQALAAERKAFEAQAQELKQSGAILQNLMATKWFQDAYNAEKGKRNGAVQDLSDEQFEMVKNDKRAFMEFVQKTAEGLVAGKVGESLSKTQKRLQELEHEREFEAIAKDHPDFKAINDSGGLDEFLEKGHDYESAYALYKLRHGNKDLKSEVEKEAEAILARRRAGAVEKSGTTLPAGAGKVVKVKNLDQALETLFQAHAQGEKNVRVVRG